MIRATVRTNQLMQRLRARTQRYVAGRAAQLRQSRRTDWHSAAALWPDLFGDPRDGK